MQRCWVTQGCKTAKQPLLWIITWSKFCDKEADIFDKWDHRGRLEPEAGMRGWQWWSHTPTGVLSSSVVHTFKDWVFTAGGLLWRQSRGRPGGDCFGETSEEEVLGAWWLVLQVRHRQDSSWRLYGFPLFPLASGRQRGGAARWPRWLPSPHQFFFLFFIIPQMPHFVLFLCHSISASGWQNQPGEATQTKRAGAAEENLRAGSSDACVHPCHSINAYLNATF